MNDTDPRGGKAAGLAAVALFALLGLVVLGAGFGQGVGFGDGARITSSIGFALFDLTGSASVGGEGFLAAFEIVDLLLVGALVGAVMLARRESETGSLRADGGDEGGDR